MGKKVSKVVKRAAGVASLGFLDGGGLGIPGLPQAHQALGAALGLKGGIGKGIKPKVPSPDASPEAPKPEEVEESVDERRKRLSILRSGLPQNTFDFFAKNPNTRKKTLLGG